MALARTRLAVAGVLGLLFIAIVGLAAYYVSTRQPKAPAADGGVPITISATACEPNAVTVTAGASNFAIRNSSSGVIEWEVLKDTIAVVERENIAPGFTVTVAAKLDPGVYQMTCGLLSNPWGTLTVTAAKGGTTAATTITSKPADLVGPMAQYRDYVIKATDDLVAATVALAAAAGAGELGSAQTRDIAAEAAFAHIAPIVELLGAPASQLANSASGFPAARALLFGAKTNVGVPVIADALVKSALALQLNAHSTTASPQAIVSGATAVVIGLSKGPVVDAAAAASSLEGVGKIIDLFLPVTERTDHSLAAKIKGSFAAASGNLATSAKPRTTPAVADKTLLQEQLSDLAADFIDLSAALGLNGDDNGQ